MSIPTARLVDEALAKSGLLWISSPAGQAPVWHATTGGVAYVVSGEGEQFSPAHEGRCEVIARSKESRARLISFDADIDEIQPESDEWQTATNALKAGRLNSRGSDPVARWAASGIVRRITPDLTTVVLRGELLPAPDEPRAEPTPDPGESASDDAPNGAKVSE